MRVLAWISEFLKAQDGTRDEQGVVMTEYVVVIALVIAGVIGVLALLWPALTGVINGAIANLP
jgi:Flp pilus assembly pilin Flp